MPLELKCTNEEKILVVVSPSTAGGAPAELDGPVNISVTSGDGSIEQVDDKSFYVVSGNELAPTTYLVEGDADLGEGVVALADTIVLNVEGPLAKSMGLSASDPVLK